MDGQEFGVAGEEGEEGGEEQGGQEEEESQDHQPDYNEQLHLLVGERASRITVEYQGNILTVYHSSPSCRSTRPSSRRS